MFGDLKAIFGFKIKMRGILYINPRKRESWGGPCTITASSVMTAPTLKPHARNQEFRR